MITSETLWFEEHDQLKDEILTFFELAKFKQKWKSKTLSTNGSMGTQSFLIDYFKNTSLLKWVDFDNHLVDIWLNKYDEDHFQEPHNHIREDTKKTVCSFCYFVDVPDEPLFFFIDGSEQRYINEQNGMIILFDSEKYHGVDMNPTTQQRKTIAGNIVVKP